MNDDREEISAEVTMTFRIPTGSTREELGDMRGFIKEIIEQEGIEAVSDWYTINEVKEWRS